MACIFQWPASFSDWAFSSVAPKEIVRTRIGEISPTAREDTQLGYVYAVAAALPQEFVSAHGKRFAIRPETALYLAHELHFASLSDAAVVRHPDWRLFGLEGGDVLRVLKTLGHDGHLVIQSSADLVQVSWKYRTMEDCLHALTQG